jgi:hypothetical protein
VRLGEPALAFSSLGSTLGPGRRSRLASRVYLLRRARRSRLAFRAPLRPLRGFGDACGGASSSLHLPRRTGREPALYSIRVNWRDRRDTSPSARYATRDCLVSRHESASRESCDVPCVVCVLGSCNVQVVSYRASCVIDGSWVVGYYFLYVITLLRNNTFTLNPAKLILAIRRRRRKIFSQAAFPWAFRVSPLRGQKIFWLFVRFGRRDWGTAKSVISLHATYTSSGHPRLC